MLHNLIMAESERHALTDLLLASQHSFEQCPICQLLYSNGTAQLKLDQRALVSWFVLLFCN